MKFDFTFDTIKNNEEISDYDEKISDSEKWYMAIKMLFGLVKNNPFTLMFIVVEMF